MEDHTIEAYLNRRTTEQLRAFLWLCMQNNEWDRYMGTIPLILDVLQKRGTELTADVLSSWHDFVAKNRE